jgi:hypothetical protein
MTIAYVKTPEAAKSIGVSYHRLINLVRFGKISPPARDSSGDFLWTPDDLQRAREAFEARRREPVGGRDIAPREAIVKSPG